jgi:hypothetical protein
VAASKTAPAPAPDTPVAAQAETSAPPPEPAEPQPALDAYEYTWGDDTVYGHIPLTAHPRRAAIPAVGAHGDTPARPPVPERPATVFAFLTPPGPPDGRWRPTTAAVNQGPDNEPPLAAEAA